MSTDLFVSILLCISLFTGLVTESLKQIVNVSNNIIAGIASIGTAIVIIIFYTVQYNVQITLQYVTACIALCILSWLSSMVGYDKVIQTIKQIGGQI